MKDDPKITVLLGGKKDDATDALLKQASAGFDAWQKCYAFEAKKKKTQFDLLVAAGFTEQQALQIIK